MIKIGVINVSDRASQGIYEDIPGKAVVELLHEYLISEFDVVYKVIPDEQKQLEEAMIHMADIEKTCLIITLVELDPPLEMLPLKQQKRYVKKCYPVLVS